MTNIAMEAMALIEIDGLPISKNGWIFPWRTVSHNQMVYIYISYEDHGCFLFFSL